MSLDAGLAPAPAAAATTTRTGSQPDAKPAARIGDRLLELGLITLDQLEVALFEQKRSGRMLGTVLVDLGFIGHDVLASLLAEASGYEQFDPKTAMIDPEVVTRIPKEVALRHRVVPLSGEGRHVFVAMCDPYDVLALDQLRRQLGSGVTLVPKVCPPAEIGDLIDRAYGYAMSIDGIVKELEAGEADLAKLDASEAGYAHPLVRLVDAILLDAVKVGASDIHFEPEELFLRLRYRIDGVLSQIRSFHREHWPAIAQRLKIVAGMNIADKLRPQDGRIDLNLGNRQIDLRVSSLPTVHGENIVLRVLDKTHSLVPLDRLGISAPNLALIERALMRPEGIFIVTGPTGSGKTTTLYAILGQISTPEVNVVTLEDPVEYQLPLLRQTQVKESTGLGFAEGVRALLRQDPDIVFIGEVRDRDTAGMAVRAAMTGHQVFTTLHTNDALSAINRLAELGLPPSMIAGNVVAVLAQRLARKLCPACKTGRPATAEECRILGVQEGSPPEIFEPVGCEVCRQAGYRGRAPVTELLPMDEELDEIVASGGTRAALKAAALGKGYRTLADDGIAKVLAGDLSLESLARAVDLSARL
jgi:type II secretory ATPase GspE/PulE/Tfp pilus assembly ATPase PilB-like protein